MLLVALSLNNGESRGNDTFGVDPLTTGSTVGALAHMSKTTVEMIAMEAEAMKMMILVMAMAVDLTVI